MDEDIKKIATLIGHHQEQEKRVNALIKAFQAESAKLAEQRELLADVINQLDSASGEMTKSVKQSVNVAIKDVKNDLQKAVLEKEQPAIDALNQVTSTAYDTVRMMNRDMSRYTWKSWISLFITLALAVAVSIISVTYFIDNGYARITEMKKMEKIWEEKAPLANIISCEGKPCVEVTGSKFTDKDGNEFYQIKL